MTGQTQTPNDEQPEQPALPEPSPEPWDALVAAAATDTHVHVRDTGGIFDDAPYNVVTLNNSSRRAVLHARTTDNPSILYVDFNDLTGKIVICEVTHRLSKILTIADTIALPHTETDREIQSDASQNAGDLI